MAYDRTIRMYDEGYPPVVLEERLKDNSLGKGAMLEEFFSYSYLIQMREIYALMPEKALEIGPGEGFVNSYLQHLGVQYDTLDIKGDPTYKTTLEEFDPVKFNLENNYDMVCCFQMLEHSPYEEFQNNLKKFQYLSKKYVFISLPYDCAGFKFSFKFHKAQRKDYKFEFSKYWPKSNPNRKYRPEYVKEFPWAVHYWEIGRKGYPAERIRNDIIDCGFKVKKEFLSENPFHYYFLLEKI